MLKIIEGGFSSLAYGEMKSEILRLTKDGRRVFLIVPEQQTVNAEKEMAEFLPDSAPLFFEVTNFTRFANTAYRALGGIAAEYADQATEALIMWKTLTELSPFLYMTDGREEINTGLVEKALSAVSEMKSIGAHPDELLALTENQEVKANTRLSRKLSDISKIMTLYKKLLEEKYASAKDECEKLSAKLNEHPDAFSGAYFFISGFTSFTEPQYDVIAELMKRAELSVHLTVSKAEYDSFEFSEIITTKEKLLGAANKLSIDKKLIRPDALDPRKSPLLCEVQRLLWKNSGKISKDDLNECHRIRIFEASDPYEEFSFIASDIRRRVMAGASFGDFAIVTRDADSYSGIINSTLTKACVPHFISIRKNLSSYEAIKLIYTAISSVCTNFKREDVISYAKCRLSGISPDACDEFELYSETWQISGDRFSDGIFWNMNPSGYSLSDGDKTSEILRRIDETRHTVIDPLTSLKENFDASETVRDYAEALVKFLTSLSVEERLYEKCAELSALCENEAAEENGRLWEIIISSLDTLVITLGETRIDVRGFESLLKILLSSADIGKIPSFFDTVTVGSADMIRLSNKKHIYLAGVNQGEFPKTPKDSSYFTERDRMLLFSLGIQTAQGSDVASARELFFFSRAFGAADEDITLIYSVRNEAFGGAKRAEVIDRISDILHGAVKPCKISELSISDRIYYPDAALDEIGNSQVEMALKSAGYDRELIISKGEITNNSLRIDKTALEVMYPADLALTQTRIDTYVGCPFAYFLRYNLKLSENERAEFDARNIGTFIHAILENFFAELRINGKAAGDISEDEKEKLVSRAAKKYLATLSIDSVSASKRTNIMLDRLCRTAKPVIDGLCEELRDCSFVPEFFELKIGGDEAGLPSPAAFSSDDGGRVSVYGSIDRVDIYKSGDDVYVRVIDYKTGSKTFSPSDLDEGKNLQMFLYLKAIVETDNKEFSRRLGVEDGGRIIPAGVIYVKTDMSDVTVPHPDKEAAEEAFKQKQQRRGMLLDDEISLSAMNKKYVPVKFKKDGTPDARSEKLLYSYDGWGELNGKISEKVREISSEMKRGNISLTSKKSDTPCDYCKFKPVCRRKN